MMNGYGGWGVDTWLMMALIPLAVLALIVAGVVALNRRSHSATPPHHRHPDLADRMLCAP
jgi:hypothetical protein